jgi:membrane protein YdbS with pleckstrin-like domain
MNTKEKMIGVVAEGQDHKLVVTHVTIRQSISVLLLRFSVLEVIAATGIIMFHSLLFTSLITDLNNDVTSFLKLIYLPLFILLVFAKTFIMLTIIIRWLNEYYEITPKEIIYRKGLIFKKEERNSLDHLGSLEIDQGLFGKIFNYGTLKLFNWATEKTFSLYLIHNPMKYHHILDTLLPDADSEKSTIREHFIEPDEI